MKISVTTLSVRKELLPIVKKCLDRQTLRSFEWIVVSPIDWGYGNWYQDPPKKEGDFYPYNKCWNLSFRKSQGELIVNITDGIWFPSDTLQRLWDHYEANPKSCITCVGNQYDKIENGKPEHCVWTDPRIKAGNGLLECSPNEMELCIGSIPRKAIFDVGGIDEEWDKYAALSEKELCYRIQRLGYKFYQDNTIEYRAIHHPRLNGEWDKHYQMGVPIFQQHLQDIASGKRLKLDYLS